MRDDTAAVTLHLNPATGDLHVSFAGRFAAASGDMGSPRITLALGRAPFSTDFTPPTSIAAGLSNLTLANAANRVASGETLYIHLVAVGESGLFLAETVSATV